MKNINYIILCCLLVNLMPVFGQGKMTKEHRNTVAEFIKCIKSRNKDSLISRVSFPFKREYPIPSIQNKQEFLKRYSQVFDEMLIGMITASDPAEDWSAVGYHGMMLLNGAVWLDYDGRLMAVNYQSDFEVKKKMELIALEKSGLHKSIQIYKLPVVILQTNKHLVRIDQMDDGTYRYASWKKGTAIAMKPDIVILKGQLIPEGSGGNHSFLFKNGKYTYKCDIIVLGEDDAAPAHLYVYKCGKELFALEADIVDNN